MSIYLRNKIWWYKFQVDGKEFRGTTKTGDAKLACAIETRERKRRNVRLNGAYDIPPSLEPLRGKLRSYEIENYPGHVYFLVEEEEVVYVGQTIDLAYRIRSHVTEARIRFNKVYWIPCLHEDMAVIEAAFIGTLKPKFNQVGGSELNEVHISELQDLGFKIAKSGVSRVQKLVKSPIGQNETLLKLKE